MSAGKHSIMIIDDHPIIHDGLRLLLANEPDLQITGGATSSTEALNILAAAEELPDLAIVDLSMGDADGTYLIQRIHSFYPKLAMLVYTMSEERLFAERTHKAGACGYIMKTTPPALLKKSIRTVLAGNLCFHPDIQARIELKKNSRTTDGCSTFDTLSNREMDIFRLLGEGQDAITIGKKLKISKNTVDTHRINIKNKLDLSSGKALERLAHDVIRNGKLP